SCRALPTSHRETISAWTDPTSRIFFPSGEKQAEATEPPGTLIGTSGLPGSGFPVVGSQNLRLYRSSWLGGPRRCTENVASLPSEVKPGATAPSISLWISPVRTSHTLVAALFQLTRLRPSGEKTRRTHPW